MEKPTKTHTKGKEGKLGVYVKEEIRHTKHDRHKKKNRNIHYTGP